MVKWVETCTLSLEEELCIHTAGSADVGVVENWEP